MTDRVQGVAGSVPAFDALMDGALLGDFSSESSSPKIAAQIGVGLIPVIGQIADARDTAAALRTVSRGEPGGWGNLGLALAGWIPLAGDFMKSAGRIGVQRTVDAVTSSISSAQDTWQAISRYSEKRMGEFKGWFYRPAESLDGEDLGKGVLGVTNRWGDIEIDSSLDGITARSTLDHERVHSALSPRFKPGQELRAKISLLGYAESHLLRRVEEGLAEAWARYQAEGIKGISRGWRFPYENPYGLNAERVGVESRIVAGTLVSGIAAGRSLAAAGKGDESAHE